MPLISSLDRFVAPDGQMLDIIRIEKPSSYYIVMEADIVSTGGLRGNKVCIYDSDSRDFLGQERSVQNGEASN